MRVPLKGSIRVLSFRKLGVHYLVVLIIRILLFGVLYQGPLFSETPIWGSKARSHFREPYP